MKPNTISPSSLQVAEKCLKRFDVEYVGKSRTVAGAPALLGTACHAALEMYTRRCVFGGNDDERTEDTLLKYYEEAFVEGFGGVDEDSEAFDDGETMLKAWYAHNEHPSLGDDRLFSTVEVVQTETKETFPVPTSAGDIPLNFIIDRADIHPELGHTVHDYKTVRYPLSAEEMHRKLQFRIYALSVEMKHPGQDLYWVFADNLRDEAPTGVAFTHDDNVATWEYIIGLAETIVQTEDPAPTLNSECGYCILNATCPAVLKSIDIGNVDTLSTEEQVDVLGQLQAQQKAASTAYDRVKAILAEKAETEDVNLLLGDKSKVTLYRKNNRVVSDAEKLRELVTPDIFDQYGSTGASISVTELDKMKKEHKADFSEELLNSIDELVEKKRAAKPTISVKDA